MHSTEHGTGTHHGEELLKKSCLFLILALFILLVNFPLLQADLMYIEQPILYGANQSIHSLHDLINIYLHPQLLDVAVPFFRPSGHFLIYQLITPFMGWHNTRAFLVVNFMFLAACCYLMIRLYEKLFPRFKSGAYIACAFYLMQPSLLLSRTTIMHFDFAHVAFLLLALNCFVAFCQQNYLALTDGFKHFGLLAQSLIFFIIAVTFKEPALMLGPVLVSYFFIFFYKTSLSATLLKLIKNSESRKIIVIITLVSALMALYLTFSWPALALPLRAGIKSAEVWGSIKSFIKILFSLPGNMNWMPGLPLNYVSLQATQIKPQLIHVIVWSFLLATAVSLYQLFGKENGDEAVVYRKSVVFLSVALLLFLVLPTLWSAGMPWHMHESLVCWSLLLGFGFDFAGKHFVSEKKLMTIGLSVAVLVGLTTIAVDKAYVKIANDRSKSEFFSVLDRNAVFYPPAIGKKLNANSLIVVEDHDMLNDYTLGDSFFSYNAFIGGNVDFAATEFKEKTIFLKHNPRYNGTLFRWAYLMPHLREEIYPFKIEAMKDVSDNAIYAWLEHFNNIFCVGYDKQNNWYDRTEVFKKNLLAEKIRRHLVVNPYRKLAKQTMTGKTVSKLILPYGDAGLCRTTCDKAKACQGFTYLHVAHAGRSVSRCDFYEKWDGTAANNCKYCTAYIKLPGASGTT